jgi:cytoskeletal protein CcmA (bactofilin family)
MLFKRRRTIIAQGLKITGSVSAEGLIEVNGHIDGDVHCTSLFISRKAIINGSVEADRIIINGRVEGPVRGSDVELKSRAHVVGDIQHQYLSIERGAYFQGRSVRVPEASDQKAPEKLTARLKKLDELKATREPVDA